jgi:hypothetical protein
MGLWLFEFVQTVAILYILWRLRGVQSKTISLDVDRDPQIRRRQ